MGNRLELIGKKFGRLTVTEFIGIKTRIPKQGKPYKNTVWKCLCDCGNYATVLGYKLTSDYTHSCGCINKERAKTLRLLPEGVHAFNSLLSLYKYGAKKRNLSWELTKQQCEFLFKSNCYFCGDLALQEHIPEKCNGSYVYNGIDRLDNKKGYTLDNSVSCCKVCNFMKRDFSEEIFFSKIKKIHDKFFKEE